jgi:hypothetical protein
VITAILYSSLTISLGNQVRRAVVDGSTNQRLALIDVVGLGGRQDGPFVVETVRPGEIGLLQIVNPLYQICGPRSVQLAIKLIF